MYIFINLNVEDVDNGVDKNSNEYIAQQIMEKYSQYLKGLTLDVVHQLIVEKRMDKQMLKGEFFVMIVVTSFLKQI